MESKGNKFLDEDMKKTICIWIQRSNNRFIALIIFNIEKKKEIQMGSYNQAPPWYGVLTLDIILVNKKIKSVDIIMVEVLFIGKRSVDYMY